MRERMVSFTDVETGVTTVRSEYAEDATFDQRIAELKASLPEVEGRRLLSVQCNGCGKIQGINFDNPKQPEGWIERSDGDFCPDCQG